MIRSNFCTNAPSVRPVALQARREWFAPECGFASSCLRWKLRLKMTAPSESSISHGFKSLLLKETGLSAIVPDMIYLSIFAVITLAAAVPLFKRTL